MQFEVSSCGECNGTIKNPICPKCVRKEIESWVSDVDIKAILEFEEFSEEFSIAQDSESATCIRCSSDFSICSWCYLNRVKSWIKSSFNLPADRMGGTHSRP